MWRLVACQVLNSTSRHLTRRERGWLMDLYVFSIPLPSQSDAEFSVPRDRRVVPGLCDQVAIWWQMRLFTRSLNEPL